MNNQEALELLQRVQQLEEENAQLKTQASSGSSLTMKVSQKGAVSVYGMGRFPVTLYADQWKRLDDELIKSGKLDEFMSANKPSLKFKKS